MLQGEVISHGTQLYTVHAYDYGCKVYTNVCIYYGILLGHYILNGRVGNY